MHLFQEYYRHFFQYMILITAGDDILPDSAEITLIQGDIYWVFKMQKKPNILQCFTRILCPYCLYLISSLELRAGSPAFCHCSCMWSPGTSLCNSALQEGLLMNSVGDWLLYNAIPGKSYPQSALSALYLSVFA